MKRLGGFDEETIFETGGGDTRSIYRLLKSDRR